MKRLGLVLLAAGLLSASPALADVYLGFQGTASIPTGENYKARTGGILTAGWSWNPRFALELGLGYWPVPVTASSSGLSRGTLSMFPVEFAFRARWPVGTKFQLSGEAGLGNAFTAFSLDAETVAAWEALGFEIDELVKDDPSAHLGIGLEYALSERWSVTLGARYHILRTRGTWTITDTISGETASGNIKKLNFDAFTLSLGVKFALFISE